MHLDEVRLDQWQNRRPRRIRATRLHTINIIPPPRTRRPPNRAPPNIAILREIRQPVLQRTDALGIIPAGKLANHALLAVVLEPLRGSREALAEDGRADAVRAGAGAVRVEVLVHLVDELVLRVFEVDERGGVAGADPGPGAGPRVAFGRDVLGGGAGGAHAVDGGLVEVEDELLVHVVVLVVGVEDDEGVVFVLRGDVLPPCLEARRVGDDVAVEAAVVVGLHHGVFALAGDVVDLLGEVA